MSTLIRLEHLSAEVRLPDGERLTTVDDASASFERGTSTAIITGVLVGTLGRDYLEAVNARLGDKLPTYSAIVDVPSSANIQVVMALQERLAHFRPGIASAQYHLNDLAIWASSGDGNTEIRRVTIIITDAERTRIMPAPIIEGTWLTGADEPATLETAVDESARQYVHDGTVALARTGNP